MVREDHATETKRAEAPVLFQFVMLHTNRDEHAARENWSGFEEIVDASVPQVVDFWGSSNIQCHETLKEHIFSQVSIDSFERKFETKKEPDPKISTNITSKESSNWKSCLSQSSLCTTETKAIPTRRIARDQNKRTIRVFVVQLCLSPFLFPARCFFFLLVLSLSLSETWVVILLFHTKSKR